MPDGPGWRPRRRMLLKRVGFEKRERRVFCRCELCRLRFGRLLYPRLHYSERSYWPLGMGRF